MKPLLGLLLLVTATAFAHPGIGIVVDSKGNVFYTDLSHVWRIAPDGTKTIAVANVHTHELCTSTNRTLLYGEHLWYNGDALNTWGSRVWMRSPDGKVVDVVPSHPGFNDGFSFVRDAAGNSYFAVTLPIKPAATSSASIDTAASRLSIDRLIRGRQQAARSIATATYGCWSTRSTMRACGRCRAAADEERASFRAPHPALRATLSRWERGKRRHLRQLIDALRAKRVIGPARRSDPASTDRSPTRTPSRGRSRP
jgi:hypothetical protein